MASMAAGEVNVMLDPQPRFSSVFRNGKGRIVVCALILSIVVELLTLALRFGTGLTAREFNKAAPLFLQVHHLFWSIPLLAMAAAMSNRPRIFEWLIAMAIACILSDLAHHF